MNAETNTQPRSNQDVFGEPDMPPTYPLTETDGIKNVLPRGGDISQRSTSEQIRDNGQPKRRVLIPKAVFKDVVRTKCLECVGFVPTEKRDCHQRADYVIPCKLASVRTRQLQRSATMKQLKAALRAECAHCLNGNPLWVCSSPNCPLYPVFVKPVHDKKGWTNGYSLDQQPHVSRR